MVGKYKVITLCGSTRSEIEYAKKNGRGVRYLEESHLAHEKRSQNNSETVFLFFGGRVFPDLPDPYPVFGGYVEFVAGLDVEGIVPVVALGEGSVDAQTVD